MGSSETDTPTKAATGAPQEQQPPATTSSSATPAVYPEWSGFQYSAIPPTGFFHSGHQAHPYMWGPQHLMPPYGTPPPPYVMYPHGGVYAHPSMPPASHPFSPYAMPSPNGNTETSVPLASGMELDGKSSDGKEKSPFKRSKGSLGSLNMITGKSNNELGKTSGASANGGSHRYAPGESGSEGSSEGSDANSQNDKTNGGHGSYDEEASENVNAARTSQNGVAHPSSQAMLNHPMPIMIMAAAGVPGVGGPTTALNIGMDYGGAPNPSSVHPVRGKVPATTVAGAILPGGITGSCENIPSELWQDERDLKRQRRKLSNRESARRSRLRKQAECEELAQRVDVLKAENSALRAEVERVRKEYDQLLAQNTSLKERLEGTQLGTVDIRPESASRATDSDSQTGPEIGL